MLAHGFTVDMLVEMVNAGLASVAIERVVAGKHRIEVALRADHGGGAADRAKW